MDENNKIIVNGILTHYGFCIKKSKYPKIILKFIKKHFNVLPDINDEDKEIKKIKVYYEDDNYLIIPKFYSNQVIDIPQTEINEDFINEIQFNCLKNTYNPETINISFLKELRPTQEKITNTVLKKFREKKENEAIGGLLQIYCGGGKTILAIYLACILKLKTLIIVHQEFLMEQWKERIRDFTNATVGIIQQSKFEKDNDITIGMLQTILSRDYEPDEFKNYGLVIYDEVHHLGSNMFSKILMKTSAKYTIGLSATPERLDGMTKIINWFCGDILYKLKRNCTYKVLVKKIYYTSTKNDFKELLKKYNGRMTPDTIKMKTNLINIETRNNLIIDVINILKLKGRKIFIFSERVEHLISLKEQIDEYIKVNEEQHIYTTAFYMGSTKKSERKHAELNGDIIFATLKLAEEGLDISRLDTIIFTMPIKQDKTLTQCIGRILRIDKFEDLMNIPLIVDISDELSCFKIWDKARNYVYDREDYFVQNYYWKDNKLNHPDTIHKNSMNIIFDDIDNEEFIEKNLIKKEEEIKQNKYVKCGGKYEKNIVFEYD